MKKRATTSRPVNFGILHVTALICLVAVALPTHADPSTASGPSPNPLPPGIQLNVTAVEIPALMDTKLATGGISAGDTGNGVPRGNEMSALAGVELERTDRRFRSRVVDWAMDRSLAAGLATDFILHGRDTGVHLRMRSSEYVVRWETRF